MTLRQNLISGMDILRQAWPRTVSFALGTIDSRR